MKPCYLLLISGLLCSPAFSGGMTINGVTLPDPLSEELAGLDLTLTPAERQASIRMELQQPTNHFLGIDTDSPDGLWLDAGMMRYGEKLSFSYNPMISSLITGQDLYGNHPQPGLRRLLKRELILNYQLTPQLELRYNANWNKGEDMLDSATHKMALEYRF